MSELRNYLENKIARGEKILSVYLTAGFPEPAATLPLLETLVEAGVDLIELGIPFSDPLADGPTIQAASQQALAAGTTLAMVLEMLRKFRENHSVPVLLMGYANPFMQFGWEKLVEQAKSAGANGFIIPDLPPGESGDILSEMNRAGLDNIFLVSPNTPPERLRRIDSLSTAFIYAVSVTGVTGARETLPQQTADFLQNLRKQTDLPLLVGFGISNAKTAAEISRYGDGVIIGSAVINQIAQNPDLQSAREAVFDFVREIKTALN